MSTRSIFIPRGGGFQVYSTMELLIFAIGGWWVADGSALPQTYLLSYQYQNASVVGHVLDPFLLQQYTTQNGTDYLRAATSIQSRWMCNAHGIWTSSNVSISQVSILDLDHTQQGRMPMVGKVSGLAKSGAQIYSVRFIGDFGFVSTYEQTDPLFILDLRDPTNPQVGGELEIADYSSYLQSAGHYFLLSIDQAVDATDSIQISLFDISDVRNPHIVQSLLVASNSDHLSSSLARNTTEYDYKAARYFADHGLLIVPMTYYESGAVSCEYYDMHWGMGMHGMQMNGMGMGMDDNGHGPDDSGDGSVSGGMVDNDHAIDTSPADCWNTTGGFDGFRVYTVSATAGIHEYMTIEHASDSSFARGCWSSAWLPPQSFILEGDIITIKGHSILSHDLTTMQEIADIVLDKKVEDCHRWIDK
jgi:Beta propeller domain